MRSTRYISKLIVNTVTSHKFWKFFGIILEYPSFGDGGDLIWMKENN